MIFDVLVLIIDLAGQIQEMSIWSNNIGCWCLGFCWSPACTGAENKVFCSKCSKLEDLKYVNCWKPGQTNCLYSISLSHQLATQQTPWPKSTPLSVWQLGNGTLVTRDLLPPATSSHWPSANVISSRTQIQSFSSNLLPFFVCLLPNGPVDGDMMGLSPWLALRNWSTTKSRPCKKDMFFNAPRCGARTWVIPLLH